jgi:diguanylate cyclase (GGDEF)-like protein
MQSETSEKNKKLLQKLKQDIFSILRTQHEQFSGSKSFEDLRPEAVDEIELVLNQISVLVSDLEKEIELKDREIEQVMITDNLTNLYTRHHLVSVLEREIARCQRYGHPLALIMIDIDDFRSFNDSYGQSVGDKMLSFAGNLINDNIREFDRAFRYGGKEFFVVMPETDITMAYIAAERIRKSFQNGAFSVINKNKSTVETASRTMSIGITYSFAYDTQAIDIEKLIDQTEKAILLAKQKGGNVSLKYEEQENSSPLN